MRRGRGERCRVGKTNVVWIIIESLIDSLCVMIRRIGREEGEVGLPAPS